jgi:hypothetical protein
LGSCSTDPRIVNLYCYYNPCVPRYALASHTPPPVLLPVCQESRKERLRSVDTLLVVGTNHFDLHLSDLCKTFSNPHGSNGSISMTIAVMSMEQGSIVTSPIEKSTDWEVEYSDSRLLKYTDLTIFKETQNYIKTTPNSKYPLY